MLSPSEQLDRAKTFHRLHVKGDPIVLFNVWDAGTARVVAGAGAKAIATGSWSVAAAQGCSDGQVLPLAVALDNLARIVAGVDLPVTIDLEAGYGDAPEVVADTVAHAIASGAIGCNLEDQIIGGDGLYSIDDQSRRIRAARQAADGASLPMFINARTDLFLKAAAEHHDDRLVDDALQRAQAYADAGASGIFVPGLVDERLIGCMCTASQLPVNIMVLPAVPTAKRLAELGVARVSHGPRPYMQMMRSLDEAARRVYAT
jgi:2-methylisocitrate lyase-like PEP mutase family enzyme